MNEHTGTQLYMFVADRLHERMIAQYADDGQQAVRNYADERRAAMRLHEAFMDATRAGDAAETAKYRQLLTDCAAEWSEHEAHPLRTAV
ncbi:hypothetical protein [Streptomyces luteireticuli]|uniref:hypothetical protein n=1 Tax=Streptomyces luteireticuli TaxID=173858 RepID=UPI003556E3D5